MSLITHRNTNHLLTYALLGFWLAMIGVGLAARAQWPAITGGGLSAVPPGTMACQPIEKQRQAVQLIPAAEVRWDINTGVPAMIRAEGLTERNIGGRGLALSGRGNYAADAIAVMDRLSRIYRLQDARREFAVKSVDRDAYAYHHVRLKQIYRGLTVVGGELLVHFDRTNGVYQVNGRYIPDLAIDTHPMLAGYDAVRRTQSDLRRRGEPEGKVKEGPALVIYARRAIPCLAYELSLSHSGERPGAGGWRYWVDAGNGEILDGFKDIHTITAALPRAGVAATITGARMIMEDGATVTVPGWYEGGYYWLLDSLWKIVNADTTGAYPDSGYVAFRATSDWGASDRVEISAANNFNLIQNYYRDVLLRNSYDNQGTLATVNVHVGTATNNAYWDPDTQQLYFLVGDNTTFTDFVGLDMCGHEFTHAVTEKTAGLTYQSESGALNESFSDIFGALIEFASQPDGRSVYPLRSPGYADWLIGEDFSLATTAIRDMRTPGSTETVLSLLRQPSRYGGTRWYTGILDNGGVHINSGVQNFFFYLLCEGGSGNNDGIAYSITPLSTGQAAQVAYLALTAYCTAETDYWAVKDAWVAAARQLNTAWVSSVEAAWAAVGLSGTPHPPASHRAINDYNGDSITELTTYYYPTGDWYIYSLLTGWVLNGANFGAYGFLPVEGDFNGGGLSDLAIYSESLGYAAIYFMETGQMISGAVGGPGWTPVSGDYDGDGISDLAFFNYPTGYWRIYSLAQGVLAADVQFGAYGFMPVEGDFNGGGQSDPAVYSESTGEWRIFFPETGATAAGFLGGRGWVPISCDYDGDGATDVTLYYYPTGYWYSYSLSRGWLQQGLKWGEYGYFPAVGDFNADRAIELAVYSPWQADWLLYGPETGLELEVSFGGAYQVPPGNWMWYYFY